MKIIHVTNLFIFSTLKLHGELVKNQAGEVFDNVIDAMEHANQFAEDTKILPPKAGAILGKTVQAVNLGNAFVEQSVQWGNDFSRDDSFLANTVTAIVHGSNTVNSWAGDYFVTKYVSIGASRFVGPTAGVQVGMYAGSEAKDAMKEEYDKAWEQVITWQEVDPQIIAARADAIMSIINDSKNQNTNNQKSPQNSPGSINPTDKNINGQGMENQSQQGQADKSGQKNQGLDYNSEPHTLKYPDAAKVFGDQRGEPQGIVDMSDRGSLLPNRSGNQGGEKPDDTTTTKVLSPLEKTMAAVAKRNIDEGIKKYPASASSMPGFKEAIEKMKDLAEKMASEMTEDIAKRAAAGDQAALDFISACNAYAAGSMSQNAWLKAKQRYDTGKIVNDSQADKMPTKNRESDPKSKLESEQPKSKSDPWDNIKKRAESIEVR